MKKLVFTNLQALGSMKFVLLLFVFSMIFILDLSASKTDNDEEIIKHDDRNQFTFSQWKSLHKLNTEALESNSLYKYS